MLCLQLDVVLSVRKVEQIGNLVLLAEDVLDAKALLKEFAAFDLIVVGGGSYHMLPFAPGSAHAAKLLALTHQALMAGIPVFGDVTAFRKRVPPAGRLLPLGREQWPRLRVQASLAQSLWYLCATEGRRVEFAGFFQVERPPQKQFCHVISGAACRYGLHAHVGSGGWMRPVARGLKHFSSRNGTGCGRNSEIVP